MTELASAPGERASDSNGAAIARKTSFLRDKLGDDAEAPRYVATVRGVGYTLKSED